MTDDSASPEVLDLLARGQKIAAIKRYRELSGAGLAEAKKYVEELTPRAARRATAAGEPDEEPACAWQPLAFVAATLFGMIGLVFTGLGVARTHAAHSWPDVEGKVVRSRLVPASEDNPTMAEVLYSYDVGGVSYRGDRISYAELRAPILSDMTQARYPAGARPRVHYDPADPTRAVLEVEVRVSYWIAAVLSLLALLWGVREWVAEAGRERAARDASA